MLFCPPATGYAQQARDFVFLFGWLHAQPQESNSAPRTRLRPNPLFGPLGIEEDFRSESVKISASSIDTLALVFKYFATDHWAFNFTGGIPRKAAIRARGTVAPTGPTGELINIDLGREEFNPVGSARQWAPLFLLEYHFGESQARLRPYVAAGFTYTFFTEVETNDKLEAEVNQRFGQPLATAAGRPGPTRNRTDLEDVFAPAFAAGLGYRLSERWKISTALAYVPLETIATVTLNANDGTRLARNRTRIHFDPVIFSLLLGYRF